MNDKVLRESLAEQLVESYEEAYHVADSADGEHVFVFDNNA